MTNIIPFSSANEQPIFKNRLSRHDRILNLLKKLAASQEPTDNRAWLAAAIVRKNKIITFGVNRMKSHPFQAKYGKNKEAIYLHAEIQAIKNALYLETDLESCVLYIARVKWFDAAKSELVQGLAKPCVGCQRAIAEFGIKRVIYTLDDVGYSDIL